MKKYYFVSLFALFLISLNANKAMSRDMVNNVNIDRIQRIERDVMLLQRQLANGSRNTSYNSLSPSAGDDPKSNASFEVRLSGIEEQLRKLLGKIEENNFRIEKLEKNYEKLQKDLDFRFNELGGAPTTTNPSPLTQNNSSTPYSQETQSDYTQRKTPNGNMGYTDISDDSAANSQREEDVGYVQTDFSTPREHYNYAFRLLNQAEYAKSAAVFRGFVEKYKDDSLIGNAHYWLGETYYIRQDYVNAADSFRKGFEALPNGQKAPDNLLKLAMSLNALNHNKESCVVLKKVVSKFNKKSLAVSQKAKQEIRRIGC
ncbi:MAG: tol-pal system protein YbgF [Rickettsiales bacterium]